MSRRFRRRFTQTEQLLSTPFSICFLPIIHIFSTKYYSFKNIYIFFFNNLHLLPNNRKHLNNLQMISTIVISPIGLNNLLK